MRHKNSAKTSDVHVQVFGTFKLPFHFLEKNCMIDFISNDLILIFYNSEGSL